MKIRTYAVMPAIAALALLSLATPARADFSPALDFTGQGQVGIPFDFTLGYQFQVGSLAYEITAIGLWATTPAAGQLVRIYEDGTTTDILSQAVLGTDPLSANGRYTYATLAAAVLLKANTIYDIVVEVSDGNNVEALVGVQSNDADITYLQPVGDVFHGIFPTADNVHLGPYFGPAFEGHSVSEVSGVPEPSSLLLLATAASLLGFAYRRR